MPERIRPAGLQPGDTIGVITPGRAALFPHRLERGLAALAGLGYAVRLGEHALQADQTDAQRVADLHAMFADPSVKAILLTLAGEAATMTRLLDLLDFDLIRSHPTILVGQSAATTLLLAITGRTGLVTFHGPSVIQHFGDVEGPDQTTVSNLLAVLQGEAVEYRAARSYSDAYQDWDFSDAPRPYQAGVPWRALRPGIARGPLLGGSLRAVVRNLESAQPADFRGAIAFWDLAYPAGSPPDPEEAPRLLAALERTGFTAGIAGLFAGKPYLYEGRGSSLPAFDAVIESAIEAYDKPVLSGIDCGHTIPMFTLPLGVHAELDANQGYFRLMESAVY